MSNATIGRDIFREAFHPVATEIREYGNLGAHPDDNQLGKFNSAIFKGNLFRLIIRIPVLTGFFLL